MSGDRTFRLNTWLRITGVCLISWLADAATKCWALNHDHAAVLGLIPGVLFALVPPLMNTSAGSVIPGAGLPHVFESIAVRAAIVIPVTLTCASLAWIYKIEQLPTKLTPLEQVGFGLLLGGTFSNLYDRLVLGKVTDFIHLTICPWWMWNVADVTIALGLFFAGLEALRLKRLIPKPLESPAQSA